ncbi:B-cell CLL/lymphoma 9 protein isoform X3 [Sorex fumeus]|uniref:B-cell CLL/lymphoma 9 protein isoform X3 n=1 Tax=Sorex fumeus TaxID=62283 RepID=UPI0024ACCE99|nr:B-cell CLL/lymphoma 9 protein isoform X3 [Sorex fumeus]
MHPSNPKVRSSPSGNTQSSPKSKQEVMVRPPTVMSPSGNPQLDSKFSNQGKQGGSASQSQPSPCESKSGGLTPKAPPGPGGSMGLKNGAGNGAKGKGKRERSISADSFDQREPGTPSDDGDLKECNSAEHIKSQDPQPTPHPMTPSSAPAPRSSTPSHGPTTAPEPAATQKTPAKVVYVFSTEMANKAAEAVLKGQVETIVSFHIQNISDSKAERNTAPVNTQLPTLRNDPKPLPQQPPAPASQDQNASQNPRLQPAPPGPAPAPKPTAAPRPLDQDSPGLENKLLPTAGSPAGPTPLPPDSTGPSSTPNNRAVTPVSQGSSSSSTDPKAPPPPPVPGGEPPALGENPDGLSQEQLEHRERSLQTLRDIQRMLFPDEREFPGGPGGGPPQNPGALDGPQKKVEGPIQAMMAQSQSLGKGPGPRTDVGAPFGPQGHRDVPFSPDEMVPPPMNAQPGPLGPEHLDHMSPEQMAWLKLQQEFYEEKRRKQEQVAAQQSSLQDMLVHPHGPRGVVRGPPPPYQMPPNEGWGPGGAEAFSDGLGVPHTLPPRAMAPHPGVAGSQMRLPSFAGMINSDMDGPGVPNPASRPGLPGVSWPDDVSKLPDARNFPPGPSVFSGPGRGDRFPNPQGLSEEMFQQQLAEKQLGLPPGMGLEGARPGLELNRMMPGAQRHLEPGNNPIFPRVPVEGPLSPSRGDFPKGMPPQLGPGRELDFGMVPSGMKGDVALNVGLGANPPMIPQKLREPGPGPEEMLKPRPGGPELLPAQQKMVPLPFGEHPQQEYGLGPRPFLPVSQGPGGGLRSLREPVGPDQRTNSRLSHMPPLPLNAPSSAPSLGAAPPGPRGLGRKPLDISVAGSQVHSPGLNPLKSPTMRQVQSPMLGSPSGNLKSPQTPSQLAGMLAGPAAAASIKSPPVLGSAAASPVHLKSPSLPAPSPGWTSSPKPPLQSPGVPPNHKAPLPMASPAMLASVESGGPPPPTASQPASVNLPGSLPSSTPYSMPPEPTLSQNPLSIMMSRMSKFAMPSSTPLYHDAIKTVASSDDDSPPARSPNLPSMNNMPGPNPVVPMPTLSPMGMTQPLSHSNQMPSPSAMAPNIPPHGVPMGPGLMSHNPIMGHGSQEPPMVPQGRMAFPQGFPPVQSPPQQVPFPHNGPSGGQGNFAGAVAFPGEGPLGRPGTLPQSSADAALCKPGGPGGPDPFTVLGNSMPSVFTDPDLQEVIRPGATGIPEFDLSRIIPSEKPSQTLQYFPRGDVPGRKQPQAPGPGFPHMQGMMGEQAPRMGLALPGMGGPGPVATPDIPLGTAPSMPGHNPMRPPAFLQQGMMGPHHRMMSPAQSTMPGQPGLMSNPTAPVGMIPGKDRGPAGLYSHPGPVGSPGMMMSVQGMMGPQQNIMIPPQMRPRGMAADVGMGAFSQGPGNPGNMMF